MCAWSLAFYRSCSSSRTTLRHAQAFHQLQARVYPLCFLLLTFSIVLLFWDLERPDRAFLAFLLPHPTPITFGVWSLTAEAVLGALLAAAAAGRLLQRFGIMRLFEALCCTCSFAVMAYTGVFLAGTSAVGFWNTWSLIALFACSSLSSGFSIVLLVGYFLRDKMILLHAVKPLQSIHLAALVLEGLSLGFFVHAAFTNPSAYASLLKLMDPDMVALAAIGVVGFGIVGPFLLESYSLNRKQCRSIPLSDVFCLFGGLMLRYVIVTCGA